MQIITMDQTKRLIQIAPLIDSELTMLTKSKKAEDERNKEKLLTFKQYIFGLISSLSEDQRFIVQRHLIDGIDWPRIVKEYSDMWGQENEKSIRSFQIYQTKALRKIQWIINKPQHQKIYLDILSNFSYCIGQII